MNRFLESRKHAGDLVGRRERYARYRGTARVNISHLKVVRGQQGLNLQRVETLKKAFANDGCHRLEPVNRIAALVSQQELAAVVLHSDLSQLTLLHGADSEDEPPKLILPIGAILRVVHGQHRLEAAKSHLLPEDAWWTVDLFLDDMSSVLITSLRQEYSDPKVYSEGEVFRQIRLCHQQEKIFQEMKWWACLRKDQLKDLKRIIAVKELREGLDKLLDVTGLWDGFRIRTMRRYLSLKCHEVVTGFQQRLLRADGKQELSTYLRHIHHVWSKITSSNSRLKNLVDVGTVRYLESRAPAASGQDASFVRNCMDTGKIFAQVLDPGLRKTVINNICAVERIIPSLWTFLEDTKHLEPCAKAVRTLLELHSKSTIYEGLSAIFVRSNDDQQRLLRQDGENHFVPTKGGDKDGFEFGYRQLWICAMRYFPSLIKVDDEGEPTKGSSWVKKPRSILWYRFARLALKLGFQSRKIELMGSASALDEAVLECISWVAGAAKGEASLDRQVADVRERLQTDPDTPPERAPSLTTEDEDLDVRKRFGHPFEDARGKVELELFMRWLYDVEEPRGKYITSSFVQRAMFHAFFGHGRQFRDEGTIEHARVEAERKIASQGAFPAPFTEDIDRPTPDVLELGDRRTVENHPSSEQGNSIFANFADIDPPPGLSDILSPRNEERGFQKSLGEIIMMLQEPTRLGPRNSQVCNGVQANYPERVKQAYDSPTNNQAARGIQPAPSEVVGLATSEGRNTNPESPISPSPLSQRCSAGPSVHEPGDALGLIDSTDLIPSRLCPLSGQETLDASLHPIIKAPMKRIREIVEESLSCVNGSVKYSAAMTARKSPKRTFQEYSTCLQSVDIQGAYTNPGEGGRCSVKRYRIPTTQANP